MNDDEALRERLVVELRKGTSRPERHPTSVWYCAPRSYRHMADAIMPMVREYRAEGERAAWVYYRDAAERESDARAEAAHAKGYEQGRRDALTDAAPEWRCPACGAVTRARMADAPDPHPGGTNPVAARVGTDDPP